MYVWNIVKATRAFFALLDHPRTVDFLEKELVPVKCTKAEIEKWLEDLNTGDEETQKKAIAKLNYFHPSLYLTPKEIVATTTTEHSQRFMYAIWLGCSPSLTDIAPTSHSLTIRLGRSVIGEEFVFETSRPDGGRGTTHLQLAQPRDLEIPLWFGSTKAVYLLSLINSKKCTSLIYAMAEGHPDAEPTRVAKEFLNKSSVDGNPGKATWQEHWDGLANRRTTPKNIYTIWEHNGHRIQILMMSMLNESECLKKLKVSLKPMIIDEKTVKCWLTDLTNQDVVVANAAHNSLLVFDPRLAMSMDDILTFKSGEQYHSRLCSVFTSLPVTAHINYQEAVLSVQESKLKISYKIPGGTISGVFPFSSLEGKTSPLWTRQRLGIIMLERLGTPEAKAILEDLAKGDKRILPTKDAVDALARWKGK